MRTLLECLKSTLPAASRTRVRKLLAKLPLADRLARVPLCPWQVGFVVGGVQKGGTTALNAFLDQHPEICMASGKEVHFFDADECFPTDGQPDYERYHRRFSLGPCTRLVGDATPRYLWWESAPARAMAYNPRMKWVLLLRQPVERAYSHWNMRYQAKAEHLSFAEAVAQEPRRLSAVVGQCCPHSYLDRGFYARQLRRLFRVVPRKQVLVLRSEDLRGDHDATLRRIFTFLGVDPGIRIAPAMIHERAYQAPLPAVLKRELTNRFADDIRDLEMLLGWDLSDWLAR